MTQTLTIRRPDDWHLHLRDGEMLAAVASFSRHFGRAIIMPNLVPPVVTGAQAAAYRDRILAALPGDVTLRPLMTLYLTETTDPADVIAAHAAGIISAVKLYPAGATTNSASGVRDFDKVRPVLEAMAEAGVPLCMHGEVTDPAVDIFDREAVFIDRVMRPLRADLPELKVVFEHLTTREGAQYVSEAGRFTAATLTPQHLMFNRNAIFMGGLRPHYYCLPVLKSEEHRQALVQVATSGSDRFFLGTDSAPHAAHLKEHAGGHAGCYTALTALELYAEVFEAAGALDKLEAFASFHGADFYGLPRNTGRVTLVREDYPVPEAVPFGDAQLKPLRGGETLRWRQLDPA